MVEHTVTAFVETPDPWGAILFIFVIAVGGFILIWLGMFTGWLYKKLRLDE